MRVTASDLITATDIMDERKKEWKKAHPDEPMPICPKCNNSGLILRVFDEEGVEQFGEDRFKAGTYDYYEPCQCVKTKETIAIKNNRNFAGVPALYRKETFETYRTDLFKEVEESSLIRLAKETAIKYVNNFDKMESYGLGLYIWSKARGCGKTHLSATISNELTARGIRNKFVSASDILTNIQKSWQEKSEDKIIQNYIEPMVLIVDDLGARSGQQWMDEKFFMIIDARYQQKKVTIFTSNYAIRSLPFSDQRIIDRILDVDRFHVIKMPEQTVRTTTRTDKTELFFELTGKQSRKKDDEDG